MRWPGNPVRHALGELAGTGELSSAKVFVSRVFFFERRGHRQADRPIEPSLFPLTDQKNSPYAPAAPRAARARRPSVCPARPSPGQTRGRSSVGGGVR